MIDHKTLCTKLNRFTPKQDSNAQSLETIDGINYHSVQGKGRRYHSIQNKSKKDRMAIHGYEWEIDIVACWATIDNYWIPAERRSEFPMRVMMAEHPADFLQKLQTEMGLTKRQAKAIRNPLINCSGLGLKSDVWNATTHDDDELIFKGFTDEMKTVIFNHATTKAIKDETQKLVVLFQEQDRISADVTADDYSTALFNIHSAEERRIIDVAMQWLKNDATHFFLMHDGLDINHEINVEQLEKYVQDQIGHLYHFKQGLLVPTEESTSDEESESKQKGYTLLDFLSIEPKPVRWFVKDLFLSGEINGLYADSDLGKSSLFMHMATCIGLGKKTFFGKEAFDGIEGAIYLASEDGFEDAQRRILNFLSFEEYDKIDESRFRFFPIEQLDDDAISQVSRFLAKRPRWAVFVDTYTDFFSGDDMKSKQQSARYMASWRNISRKCQATILLAHHINKSSREKTAHKNNATESKAFTDGCRVAVELQERSENSREFGLTITKGNMIKRELKAKSLLIWKEEDKDDFRFHTANVYVPKEELITCSKSLANENEWEVKLSVTMTNDVPATTTEIMALLGVEESKRRTVQRFLAGLVQDGKLMKVKEGVFKLP